MPFAEIPINLGNYKSKNPDSIRNSGYAEELINLFVGATGNNYDRPTLNLFVTLPSNESIGMYYFDDVLVVVTADRKIYTVASDETITDITGVTLPGNGRPVFTDNIETLLIAGGGTPIKWDGVGNLTEDLGGGPPATTHLAFLDGFLFANRRLDSENNKVVQFSDFEDVETWDGGSFFSAVAAPDEVAGLTVCQREAFIVGEKTTEIWQNVGASPVPFDRAYIWQFGTSAKYSIIVFDNSVFFLDQDRRVLRISGRELARISQPVEDEFASFETVSDCITSSFSWNDSSHILFVFPSARKTWSIDLANNQWTEWKGYDNGWIRPRINCSFYSRETQTTYAGDFSTGRIWKFSNVVKTDAGNVFKRLRKFCQIDRGGSSKKQARVMRINMKRNVATSYTGTLPETNPTLEIRWRDDGKEWTNFRQIPLGQIGEYRQFVEVHRLGIYQTRQYEIQFSDPAELNIIKIEADEEALV